MVWVIVVSRPEGLCWLPEGLASAGKGDLAAPFGEAWAVGGGFSARDCVATSVLLLEQEMEVSVVVDGKVGAAMAEMEYMGHSSRLSIAIERTHTQDSHVIGSAENIETTSETQAKEKSKRLG